MLNKSVRDIYYCRDLNLSLKWGTSAQPITSARSCSNPGRDGLNASCAGCIERDLKPNGMANLMCFACFTLSSTPLCLWSLGWLISFMGRFLSSVFIDQGSLSTFQVLAMGHAWIYVNNFYFTQLQLVFLHQIWEVLNPLSTLPLCN